MKLTVLYGKPTDAAAFEKYYAETHIPLALRNLPKAGVERLTWGKVVGTPQGGEAPPYRWAEAYFESLEALQEGLSSPEGAETAGDLQNFATGGATFIICDLDQDRTF